jgi:hypothetical protein
VAPRPDAGAQCRRRHIERRERQRGAAADIEHCRASRPVAHRATSRAAARRSRRTIAEEKWTKHGASLRAELLSCNLIR